MNYLVRSDKWRTAGSFKHSLSYIPCILPSILPIAQLHVYALGWRFTNTYIPQSFCHFLTYQNCTSLLKMPRIFSNLNVHKSVVLHKATLIYALTTDPISSSVTECQTDFLNKAEHITSNIYIKCRVLTPSLCVTDPRLWEGNSEMGFFPHEH